MQSFGLGNNTDTKGLVSNTRLPDGNTLNADVGTCKCLSCEIAQHIVHAQQCHSTTQGMATEAYFLKWVAWVVQGMLYPRQYLLVQKFFLEGQKDLLESMMDLAIGHLSIQKVFQGQL